MILECEGAVSSCSIVHLGSPVPVLVAVQPLGGAPTASASKLIMSSAMALTSTKQRAAAAAVGPGLDGSSLLRVQFPDVLNDLVDLRVAEHRAEGGHRARL